VCRRASSKIIDFFASPARPSHTDTNTNASTATTTEIKDQRKAGMLKK
jgi:hypothetical protein